MTYTVKRKEKRPAGDWLVIAINENGKIFHHCFYSEPTDTEVNQLAEKKAAENLIIEAEIAAKAAEEAEAEE